MKQRNRLMQNENDLNSFDTINKNTGDIQLHKMQNQEHYIEAQVQEGDTLQALALRFYCSISELKRINKIHKDNEIFARRTIKVPVTPYSVLTELMPEQSDQGSPSHLDNNLLLSDDFGNGSTINTNQGKECTIDCNTIVMNSTLAPSVVPYMDSEQVEPVSEDTKLLPNKEKSPVEAVVVRELTSQGADLGLKWFHLVCCMLVLGVVIPIVYVLFYVHENEHSQDPALHQI